MFAPKISLFQVPGHVQGIRVENLLVLLFFVCAFAKWGFRLKFRFPIFWLFFVWGALSTLVSYIDQNNINFMILIRMFEYGIVCSVTWICVVKYYSNVERALIFYLFVNIIFSLMRKFGLIGGFSSGGFLHAGHDWLGRPYGLLGGPWELAIVSFFISLILIENKNYPIYFKFIIF